MMMLSGLDNSMAISGVENSQQLRQLRETSGQIVGSVFFGTLLKQMRESSLQGEYGHGGRGEEAFMGQLHQILAERIGEASGNSLSDALYRTYERQQQLISNQRTAGEDS